LDFVAEIRVVLGLHPDNGDMPIALHDGFCFDSSIWRGVANNVADGPSCNALGEVTADPLAGKLEALRVSGERAADLSENQ
jgi:hypothetical protein